MAVTDVVLVAWVAVAVTVTVWLVPEEDEALAVDVTVPVPVLELVTEPVLDLVTVAVTCEPPSLAPPSLAPPSFFVVVPSLLLLPHPAPNVPANKREKTSFLIENPPRRTIAQTRQEHRNLGAVRAAASPARSRMAS
jgi:hypothetical protein